MNWSQMKKDKRTKPLCNVCSGISQKLLSYVKLAENCFQKAEVGGCIVTLFLKSNSAKFTSH